MGRQYVGIDFHRRRSVVVRMSATGEKLSTVRIADDPVALAAAVAAAGPEPEVVIEATYGWYWVVDLLQANGARVHLANPQGLNWGQRRVKNDERDAIAMAHSYTTRVASLRDLIEVYDGEVGMLEGQIHRQLRHHRGYRAIHAINGVGPTIAAILVAEIGDVARFRSAEALCSWAGLTPKHRESDTIVRRGRITKQGSKLVRWAVSRRCLATTAAPSWPVTSAASPSGEAPTRPGWRWPAKCSRSSTTACATARSVASLGPKQRETVRTRPGASP